MLKSCVEVVDHIVALVDRVSNDSLHPLTLLPRLSINIIVSAVSTEERIIHAELVKSYPDILRWDANEAWYISSTKYISSKTILHDHLDRSKELGILSVVVSSPVCAKFLGAEEKGP